MSPTAPSESDGTFPLLRRTELRRLLTEEQLHDLEGFCHASVRKAGATIFRQGEPAETFYVLVDGTVELRARPPGRRVYRTVELVSPSCTFGDEAILGELRYVASARALEPARMCSLSRTRFGRLATTHPDIALGVLRCAGGCLIRTIRRAAILTQAPADVGLRMLLHELAGTGNGASRPVRITHAQLAGVLHVSRETISRMLGQLAGEGAVELGRGVIRVQGD
jgi:CRP/FNR family transcriptional regulator, cyclic AMP receptor protein